jgi:gas vesicle protein
MEVNMSSKDFFFGAVLGALAGVLFAPKSGKETREGAKTYYLEMKDQVLEEMGKVKDISRETYEKVVNSVVRGYEDTRKITSREAVEIKQDLKSGYDRMQQLVSGWRELQEKEAD